MNHRHLVDRLAPRLGYDGADVSAWQRNLRGVLADLIGLTRMPPPGETTVRVEWIREESLGTIEKIVFPSEPGADIVGYFCTPHHVPAPLPVVICLQGHTTGMHLSIARTFDEAAPIAVDGDRDFALGAMRHGYAALCIEQRGFGLRREQPQEQASIMNIYHCADNYVPGLMLWAEAADVLGLFAPKPVVVVAGRQDPLFPIDGVTTAFASLRQIYAAAGATDHCRLVVGEGGHRFYEKEAWQVLTKLL